VTSTATPYRLYLPLVQKGPNLAGRLNRSHFINNEVARAAGIK